MKVGVSFTNWLVDVSSTYWLVDIRMIGKSVLTCNGLEVGTAVVFITMSLGFSGSRSG